MKKKVKTPLITNIVTLEQIEKAYAAKNTKLPSGIENNPDEPIMVVFSNGGTVYWAGQPRKPTAAECKEWFQPGFQVITMTIKHFRESNFKWIYDEQSNEQPITKGNK